MVVILKHFCLLAKFQSVGSKFVVSCTFLYACNMFSSCQYSSPLSLVSMKLQDNLAKEFSSIYADFRRGGNSHIKSDGDNQCLA